MSFKKHQQAGADWREWVRKHREELDRCGIPEAILESSLRWHVFLEHGWDQWTRWPLDQLDGDGAKIFYRFMLREYGHQREWYSSTFHSLEQRLGLSPSRVMLNRLSGVVDQIQANCPGIASELEPCQYSVRLWLYNADRTFLLEGFLGGGFDVREIEEADGFKVDDFDAYRLEDAVTHVLKILQPCEDQATQR